MTGRRTGLLKYVDSHTYAHVRLFFGKGECFLNLVGTIFLNFASFAKIVGKSIGDT